MVSCQTCGATVSFGGDEISKTCDFCGSQHILEREDDAGQEILRPERLIPFAVDQDTARQSLGSWLSRGWFRPGDLTERAHIEDLGGVYIPFWAFDASVHSYWRAEAGYHYDTQEVVSTEDGQQQRTVQKTDWRPVQGERRDHYQDVLVVASKGLPEKLADLLADSFDLSQLRPYEPSYLTGWRAEQYSIEIDDAWKKAAKQIERQQQIKCGRDVPGDTHRSLRVDTTFVDKSYEHILLPLWITSYRYGDKVYRCLVNGQTGKVSGEAPLSWPRVAAAIALVAAIVVGLILFLTRS